MDTKRPILAGSSLAGVLLLATSLVGCGTIPAGDTGTGASHPPSAGASGDASTKATDTSTGTPSGSTSTPSGPLILTSSVEDGAKGVKVDTIVSVKASAGTVSKVKLWTKAMDPTGRSKRVKVSGEISKDGATWSATSALDPGSKYRLEMEGKAADQSVATSKSSFTTQRLSLNEQTYATIYPTKGSTMGVGMPVMVNFDLAIKDRKEFEKHLSVTSTGNQEGSWRWYGDKKVHFRPRHYWKPGTKVTVEANLNGVSAGGGVYGQKSISTSFSIGRSVVTKVDLKSKQAKVYLDGRLARKIPVSGGKRGWASRSGKKLVMQKLRMTRMTNEAIGAAEHYDFKVPYAMRVTTSGEFLHAAPWKEGKGQFGRRNTSHGCIGMSTTNAHWLFNKVQLGDPVLTTGTKRGLEQGNGWSDWDLSYKQYKKGSAL